MLQEDELQHNQGANKARGDRESRDRAPIKRGKRELPRQTPGWFKISQHCCCSKEVWGSFRRQDHCPHWKNTRGRPRTLEAPNPRNPISFMPRCEALNGEMGVIIHLMAQWLGTGALRAVHLAHSYLEFLDGHRVRWKAGNTFDLYDQGV